MASPQSPTRSLARAVERTGRLIRRRRRRPSIAADGWRNLPNLSGPFNSVAGTAGTLKVT